jgi:hypothetical protein
MASVMLCGLFRILSKGAGLLFSLTYSIPITITGPVPSYVNKKFKNFCPSQFAILGIHYFKFFLESLVTGVTCLDMMCDFLIFQSKGNITQENQFFSMWCEANSLMYVLHYRKCGLTCIESRKSASGLLYIKSVCIEIVHTINVYECHKFISVVHT